KLIDDNVLMKKGSRGTRVGTVQKFLVEYGIKLSIDNDYGDSVVAAVKKFQSEQKLSADGQAGPGTYKKMIEWLANN
ncbi:MAG TPA: peptidoglycan-binding domain-containing protein, partial [Candidatus Paceibacterota bacterium]|nr:peptidoglycan-binding domain-containing protein [Candidatus Paceibacterota bacterium]